MGKRTPVICEVCGTKISRKADLGRHMKLHAPNKEELKHRCPYLNCNFSALQQSNLSAHLNTHTGEKPHVCFVEGCGYRSADPSSLSRHRKEVHGLQRRGKGGSQLVDRATSTRARRAATRHKTLFYSIDGPSDATRDQELAKFAPLSELQGTLDTPASLAASTDFRDKSAPKNGSIGFDTNLHTRRDVHAVPDLEAGCSSWISEPLVAPGEPIMDTQPMPVIEQGNLAAYLPLEVTDSSLADFLALFNNSQDGFTSSYTPAPSAEPIGCYPIHGEPTAPYVPPTLGYEDIFGSMFAPSVPSNAGVPSIDPYVGAGNYMTNSQAFRYATDATALNAQMLWADPSTAMGTYPKTVDPTYGYPARAGSGEYPMQGFCYR